MNSKFKIFIYIIVAIFLILVSIKIANNKSNKLTVQTSSSAAFSNTKIGWGIKRNKNHSQPDLGKKNKELIEK